MKYFLLLVVYSLCGSSAITQDRSPQIFKLFYLGGQSNMELTNTTIF